MNPQSGTTLGSRYTLTDRIAAGGMGDVWRATDSVLGRVVAVKVMRASAAWVGLRGARAALPAPDPLR